MAPLQGAVLTVRCQSFVRDLNIELNQVTVDGGEKLYESTTVDPVTRKLLPAGWKSVGQRQRVRSMCSPDL